jgi:hypothetical protein
MKVTGLSEHVHVTAEVPGLVGSVGQRQPTGPATPADWP